MCIKPLFFVQRRKDADDNEDKDSDDAEEEDEDEDEDSYGPCSDDDDDEETLLEQEQHETSVDHSAEIAALQEEGSTTQCHCKQ